MFYGVIYQKAKELDLRIHAVGNVDDHIHIVVSVPPKIISKQNQYSVKEAGLGMLLCNYLTT